MTGPTQGDSWWSVDLEKNHKIGVVQIYPRLDDKQSHTINDATVSKGAIPINPDPQLSGSNPSIRLPIIEVPKILANSFTLKVRVGEHVCGLISYSQNQRMYAVDCEGAQGDKVTVMKLAALALCEVKVFGKAKSYLLLITLDILFFWGISLSCQQQKD